MTLKDDVIKIYASKVLDEKTTEEPGTLILNQKNHLKIACGLETVLEILELQPAGKKVMKSQDFINGSLRKYL